MLSTAKSRDLRSVRTASLEYIFLERYADLLSEKEADVSLSAEEFTMSKGGGGGRSGGARPAKCLIPPQLLGKLTHS